MIRYRYPFSTGLPLLALIPSAQTATAEGNGLKLAQILLERSGGRKVANLGTTTHSVLPSQPEAQQPLNTASLKLELSDDGSILTLFDERLIFRGLIQRSFLRLLVDAYSKKKPLKTAEALRKSGTQLDGISKLFRKNRHWPKLRKIIRQESGFCWINLSTPP